MQHVKHKGIYGAIWKVWELFFLNQSHKERGIQGVRYPPLGEIKTNDLQV